MARKEKTAKKETTLTRNLSLRPKDAKAIKGGGLTTKSIIPCVRVIIPCIKVVGS
jgi:hypothetical protein